MWSLFSIILTFPRLIGTATNPPTTTLTQDLIVGTFPSAAPAIPNITIDKIAATKAMEDLKWWSFINPAASIGTLPQNKKASDDATAIWIALGTAVLWSTERSILKSLSAWKLIVSTWVWTDTNTEVAILMAPAIKAKCPWD